MVGQAANAIPPNEPVSVDKQEEELKQVNHHESNGQPPQLTSEAAQAAMRIQQKYAEERQKRLRDDGNDQYVDLALSEKFKHYAEDPWLDERSDKVTIQDGEHVKYLILGAGWAGVQFAVKLVQAGISVSEIRIVDSAGGFGGTWYYNRYPGLMCDVESYCYLPFLEETQYMPKHKYSYGHEIRDYINTVADKYEISPTAMFSTKINKLAWDDSTSNWSVNMTKSRRSESPLTLNITAHMVLSGSGLLLHPKLPAIAGIEKFEGTSFHTSRWNYHITGGSQTNPTLDKLKDKRVGIVGTGATAIQAVPHLAAYAKHLTIFQRTPSSVDTRDQRPTSPTTWASTIASGPGWWKNRNLSFARHLSDPHATVPDLVNDGWTRSNSYRGLIGSANPPYSMDTLPAFVAALHAGDMPRAERVRARTDEIVKDKKTAASLKAYYPIWCKRPTFHDEYLPVFNQPNVTLVDTDGQGVKRLTATGAVAGGEEYPLDVLIFSTGFRSPSLGALGERAGMTIKGRDGKDLDEQWNGQEGVNSLHGCMVRGFPNFFYPGPFQAAATANANFTLNVVLGHVAWVISEAEKKKKEEGEGKKVVVEPTAEGEARWAGEVLKRSMAFAGMAGCTPSYLNAEGRVDSLPMEERVKMGKGGIWGEGIEGYIREVERWEQEGKWEGLEVKLV